MVGVGSRSCSCMDSFKVQEVSLRARNEVWRFGWLKSVSLALSSMRTSGGCLLVRWLPFFSSCSGYQVFLGNTRGVFGMGHKTYGRNEPRFWGRLFLSLLLPGASLKGTLLLDWTIRELAMYDLPALVEEVRRLTGYEKVRPWPSKDQPSPLPSKTGLTLGEHRLRSSDTLKETERLSPRFP